MLRASLEVLFLHQNTRQKQPLIFRRSCKFFGEKTIFFVVKFLFCLEIFSFKTKHRHLSSSSLPKPKYTRVAHQYPYKKHSSRVYLSCVSQRRLHQRRGVELRSCTSNTKGKQNFRWNVGKLVRSARSLVQ